MVGYSREPDRTEVQGLGIAESLESVLGHHPTVGEVPLA